MLLFVAAVAVRPVADAPRDRARRATSAHRSSLAAAVTSLLGYALLTRMHERYMFLGARAPRAARLLAPAPARVRGALGLFLLSLWFPFAYYNTQLARPGTLQLEPLFGWIFGGFAYDTWQKRLLSLAVVAIAVLASPGVASTRWAAERR